MAWRHLLAGATVAGALGIVGFETDVLSRGEHEPGATRLIGNFYLNADIPDPRDFGDRGSTPDETATSSSPAGQAAEVIPYTEMPQEALAGLALRFSQILTPSCPDGSDPEQVFNVGQPEAAEPLCLNLAKAKLVERSDNTGKMFRWIEVPLVLPPEPGYPPVDLPRSFATAPDEACGFATRAGRRMVKTVIASFNNGLNSEAVPFRIVLSDTHPSKCDEEPFVPEFRKH